MNLFQILIVLAIAYLIFQYLTPKSKPKPTKPTVAWTNQPFGHGYGDSTNTPKHTLEDIIKEYGNPNLVDTTSGGHAIWTRDQLENTPFERIEIHDIQIPDQKPIPHTEYLFTHYRINIPAHLAQNLHHISSGIQYDPRAKIQVSRSNSIPSNIVTHWIVKQYANYKLTIDEAVNMYGPMTMEILEDQTGMKSLELLNEL